MFPEYNQCGERGVTGIQTGKVQKHNVTCLSIRETTDKKFPD